MKQGNSLITFVILALAAVVSIYLGTYAFNSLEEPYQTTLVYPCTVSDSVLAEGLVAREALVLTAPAGILEVTRAEGEKVGKGQQVALVYQNTQAQASQAQIEELEMEIELLEYVTGRENSVDSAARLDEDILQAVVDLRSSYARGDYTQLRDQVMGVKSSVLKRGYTYGEGLASGDLTARLRQLKEELAVLTRQSALATVRVSAPVPGVFSGLVDGYESRLTPETVYQLTPTSLQELINSPAGEDSGAMGKLITSDTWYFAANLPKSAAARLEEGDTATLRFTGELNRDVDMNVDRIGPTEGEQTLVVFSSNRYLTLTTLLRHQTVELVFESWSGLRIPKAALHLEEVTEEDPDSSAPPVVVKKLVVYASVNGHAEMREVSIVHEDEDYYVVRPLGTGKKVLRDGDVIITHATGLIDGLTLKT
mgnify:CR=1 FL=1